jgi:hypothetical protein
LGFSTWVNYGELFRGARRWVSSDQGETPGRVKGEDFQEVRLGFFSGLTAIDDTASGLRMHHR